MYDSADHVPFLFLPGSALMNTFKGIGTNSRTYAKRYALMSLAMLYWNKARTEIFGSKPMVVALSMCLRCYMLVGEENLKTKKTSMDPDSANRFYMILSKYYLDMAKFSKMAKPPAQCPREKLEECINILNSCVWLLKDASPPSRHIAFVQRLIKHTQQELLLIVGVFILTQEELPFSAIPRQGYMSVRDTARLLTESRACLQHSTPIAQKFIDEITLKLASGYAAEYREDPVFYKHILNNNNVEELYAKGLAQYIISSPVDVNRIFKDLDL